jgi:GT2 family glycosyltransferase
VLRYLEQAGADPRVCVLRDDRPFNFSALNNSAVEQARGDLVCLLNNDTEVIDDDWLRKLVAQAVRPEIGCAGAKLLYPDDTIQHAGVLLGLHGLAGHPYRLMSRHHPGYFGRLTVAHAVSAVTAACLVVERRIYRQVGGLDDRLAVAFNDVDFCLKVRKLGLRNLLVPHAVLLHHESASRGLDQNAAQRQRFLAEVALVKERWREAIYADPCYSPHLSLDYDDYSLRSR